MGFILGKNRDTQTSDYSDEEEDESVSEDDSQEYEWDEFDPEYENYLQLFEEGPEEEEVDEEEAPMTTRILNCKGPGCICEHAISQHPGHQWMGPGWAISEPCTSTVKSSCVTTGPT